MYRNLQYLWNLQVRTFSNNPRYKYTTTKTLYDINTGSSLQTSTTIALGLLEKKGMMKILHGGQKWILVYLVLHKRILAVWKVATNADTKECPHSQTSLKVSDSEEKLAFSFRLPLRCYIAQLAMFSSDPGILLSLCASAPHPHTTLAIGEWMISWLGNDSLVKSGPLSVATILFSSHPYM